MLSRRPAMRESILFHLMKHQNPAFVILFENFVQGGQTRGFKQGGGG
jgi:hypothetical protein